MQETSEQYLNGVNIGGVRVVAHALDGSSSPMVMTDSAGKFIVPLTFEAKKTGYVNLSFSHDGYEDMDSNEPIIDSYPTFYLWPSTTRQSAPAYSAPKQPQFTTATFLLAAGNRHRTLRLEYFRCPTEEMCGVTAVKRARRTES